MVSLDRRIEVEKYFWSLAAINYLLPTFITEWKAKFQLQVSENEVVIFFPSKFTNPLKSMYGPPGVCGSQVMDGWYRGLLLYRKNVEKNW